jgi:predicted nucleic acid-binding protein
MGAGRGLIDTSVVLALEVVDRSRLPEALAISAVTLAELSSGPCAAKSATERARRQDRLQRVESRLESIEFDAGCARAFGSIYAAVREAGRKARGARVADLMIAATALAHRLPLYTLNAADLRGLEDLIEVVDLSQSS